MSVETEPYVLLPFHFKRFPNSKILIVNEVGEYQFLEPNLFDNLVSYRLDPKSKVFLDLKGKHLATDTNVTPLINLLATKYRTKKAFLKNFTILHMVVVTLRCNHRCHYCHASSQSPESTQWDMEEETAINVVRTIMETPAPAVKIEFQGGEPTLNFNIVKTIVKKAKAINQSKKKDLSFVICTNLVKLSEPILNFLKKENILVSTSLDGPKEIHDRHRILREGGSSYDLFFEKLETCRRALGKENVSALMTTTRDSLSNLNLIIDEYLSRSFHSIFIRSLNPYGYASDQANRANLSYPMEAFTEAYKEALLYIIDLNMKGIYFVEDFAAILLSRILTPFSTGFVDLQSPTGAGISGVIYNFNGDVYPSDEARMLAKMGNTRFRMGNVNRDTYMNIFRSPVLHELINSSCLETLPGCHSCALQIFCGADPIRNYATQGNLVGHVSTSESCAKHKGIIEFLLELIDQNDPKIMDVFWSWVTRRPLNEIRGQA